MAESLAEFLYSRLREHESFDYGTWEELTPGQRAYVGGAAERFIREMQRRYAQHSRLRDNWIDEGQRQGTFDV